MVISINDKVEQLKQYTQRFSNIYDLAPLVQEASKASFVLLGEASHGTSEFYTIRTEITKKLINDYNFSYVAVEGDWPSCFEVNRYVKGEAPEYIDAKSALKSFNRWPTWMWANVEVVELIEWIRKLNENRSKEEKVGFYGMDVYSLWESMESIIHHLEKIGSSHVEKAKKAFECFEPFHRKPEEYAVSSAFYGEDCLDSVTELFHALRKKEVMYETDSEASLNMQVNALVAKNAESYYHAMITNDNESWNIRDRHMVEALEYIKDFYGENAKGIVWEHNTHIGDARATDMADEGMVNVGQLVREEYGRNKVYAVGFGTYKGTVVASSKWGNPLQVMQVPPAVKGSWEDLLHQAGAYNKFLMFTSTNKHHFQSTIGHRAIGVVYNPEIEHLGNYVPSQIADRYDAFIHIEESQALKPLE